MVLFIFMQSQKTVFQSAKGNLLQCNMPPFASQEVTFRFAESRMKGLI